MAIPAYLKERRKKLIEELWQVIGLTAGINIATKKQYSQVLVEHGYLKMGLDGRFEILRFE